MSIVQVSYGLQRFFIVQVKPTPTLRVGDASAQASLFEDDFLK
jgi:hypothetical protein